MSATPNTSVYDDPEWIAENDRLLAAAQDAVIALMRHGAHGMAHIMLTHDKVNIGEVRVYMFPTYNFPTN